MTPTFAYCHGRELLGGGAPEAEMRFYPCVVIDSYDSARGKLARVCYVARNSTHHSTVVADALIDAQEWKFINVIRPGDEGGLDIEGEDADKVGKSRFFRIGDVYDGAKMVEDTVMYA